MCIGSLRRLQRDLDFSKEIQAYIIAHASIKMHWYDACNRLTWFTFSICKPYLHSLHKSHLEREIGCVLSIKTKQLTCWTSKGNIIWCNRAHMPAISGYNFFVMSLCALFIAWKFWNLPSSEKFSCINSLHSLIDEY